jgi:hypothetical protein
MKNYRLPSDLLVFDRLFIQLPGSLIRWMLFRRNKGLVEVAKEKPLLDMILGVFIWIALMAFVFN